MLQEEGRQRTDSKLSIINGMEISILLILLTI
jgi:hypothetical protein